MVHKGGPKVAPVQIQHLHEATTARQDRKKERLRVKGLPGQLMDNRCYRNPMFIRVLQFVGWVCQFLCEKSLIKIFTLASSLSKALFQNTAVGI